MLNILKQTKKIFLFSRLLKHNSFYFSSTFSVVDFRAQSMLVVKDETKQLQYMREIQIQNGAKGIVMKMEEPNLAYIGLYEKTKLQNASMVSLKSINIPWRNTVQKTVQKILLQNRGKLFSMNQQVQASTKVDLKYENIDGKYKIRTLSPILQSCYDIHFGSFINFQGCLGSKKTVNLNQIQQIFSRKNNHYSLYLNFTSQQQIVRSVQDFNCFSWNYCKEEKKTDVGIFMLTAKVIHIAQLLKASGKQVLLGIDGFKNILQAEWHMLRLLGSSYAPNQTGYSFPKISPISLINQIYSACQIKKNGKGSLTTIVTTQQTNKDQLIPEITPYTNNIKHLNSLTKKIKFPLNFQLSSNHSHQIISNQENMPSMQHCTKVIKTKINTYLKQKDSTQLIRKLYKNQIKDAPWDFYQILDTQWWLQGIKSFKCNDYQQISQLFSWIYLNIELEFIPHWKINCLQSFSHYKKFLQKQELSFGKSSLNLFSGEAKIKGIFSPFKKDYLN